MDVIVYGGGLLGRQVHYLIETYFKDKLNVLGFIDDVKEHGALIVNGLYNCGPLKQLNEDPDYSPEKVKLILAIGYSDMVAKKNAFLDAKELGYKFETIIHPNAVVEKNVVLGEGIIILAGVVIDQYVTVKDINYFDIGALIGENTCIERNNYLSAGTTIGGSVKIGEDNFFGLNTTVVNDISIGNNNFVNAKSLIYKKLGDNKRVVMFQEQRFIGR